MPKEFVTDVGFWGIHGPGTMSDVLGGMEDSKGQTSQEVSG